MGNNEVLRTRYLIIGNSAGGVGAAEAIREVDKVGSLTMVSEEPYPAYSRPLISKYLSNERSIEGMLFRAPDFYDQNKISLLLGKKVSRLEPATHVAQLEGGDQMIWEKLLLATGGIPVVPRIEGLDKRGVFTFLTIKDAQRVADFIGSRQQAVVIGGGLIGISVAEALIKKGIGVTVVEMKSRVLNTVLDETGSEVFQDALSNAKVKVITNHTAAKIAGNTAVDGVVLDDGQIISCNLIIMAIGVLPRIDLVSDTEIKVNRGIVVDRYMSTSQQDVFACGDAAEAYDFVYNANRVIPIWPNAYMGGRVAGYNMAGTRTQYLGSTAMNSLNYFGLDIATAGVVVPPDSSDFEVISKRSNGVYKKIILESDYVAGMVFIQDIEKSGMFFGLMRDHINVRNFKQHLLEDNFGLAYLPQELWKERLGLECLNERY